MILLYIYNMYIIYILHYIKQLGEGGDCQAVRLALATPLSYTFLAEQSPQAPHKQG